MHFLKYSLKRFFIAELYKIKKKILEKCININGEKTGSGFSDFGSLVCTQPRIVNFTTRLLSTQFYFLFFIFGTKN